MSMIKPYRLATFALLALLLVGIFTLFPWLFQHLIQWQREFNQLISNQLHQIKQTPTQAGGLLILVSFLYGVLHALGPGHGKFVIASYLSTHPAKLKTSMRLSFLSSLMQGIVAVIATSIIVVILNLSSAYFKASQLWLERAAYGLIILLGVQWIYQGIKQLLSTRTKPKKFRIYSISATSINQPSAVKFSRVFHQHSENCDCGHQHLPNAEQLNALSWKSQLFVIFSIGMRPCTGAIFVLFLAFMLDLYPWGIIATMAMSFGTGLMLSGFAAMVQYARQSAVKLGGWYLKSSVFSGKGDSLVKLTAGTLLIFFAASLIFATTMPSSGGAVLFGR